MKKLLTGIPTPSQGLRLTAALLPHNAGQRALDSSKKDFLPAVAAPGNPLSLAPVLSLGPGTLPAVSPLLTIFLRLGPSQLTVHIRALPEARTHSPGASSRGAQL